MAVNKQAISLAQVGSMQKSLPQLVLGRGDITLHLFLDIVKSQDEMVRSKTGKRKSQVIADQADGDRRPALFEQCQSLVGCNYSNFHHLAGAAFSCTEISQ
jgi:hypothetical protein